MIKLTEEQTHDYFRRNLLQLIVIDDVDDPDSGKCFLAHGPYRLSDVPLFDSPFDAYRHVVRDPILISSLMSRCVGQAVLDHIKSLNPSINV